MVLVLSAALDRASYRPGEAIYATVQVANEAGAGEDPQELGPFDIGDLRVQCWGVEHLDAAWINPTFRGAGGRGEGKGQGRKVFEFAPAQLIGQATLGPDARRRFSVKVALPAALPPTFKGQSVRYSYSVDVAVTAMGAKCAPAAAGDAPIAPMAVGGTSTAAAAVRPGEQQLLRLPFRVWPPAPSPDAQGGGAVPLVEFELGCPGADLNLVCKEMTAVTLKHMPLAAAADDATASPGMRRNLSISALGELESQGGGGGVSAGPPLRMVPGGVGVASLMQSQDSRHQRWISPPSSPAAGGGAGAGGRSDGRGAGGELPEGRGAGGGGGTSDDEDAALLAHAPARSRSFCIRLLEDPILLVAPCLPPGGVHRPGGAVSGSIDLTVARPGGARCVQLTITLETEEVLAAAATLHPSKSSGTSAIRRVHNEYTESVGSTASTFYLFSLPPDAPTSFATPMLAVRWLLRFEIAAQVPGKKGGWDAEKLHWALPLLVGPSGEDGEPRA